MTLNYGAALDFLKAQLIDVDQGSGRIVLVTGSLANGKTTLLHDFSRHVRELNALHLGSIGSRSERTLQAGVLDQLLHSASLPPETVEYVSHLPTATLYDQRSGDDSAFIRQDWVREVRNSCEILLELARSRLLVISVDDVQFADDFSLEVLLALRRRMDSERILIILAQWDWPYDTRPLFRAEVTRQPYLRMQLAPLSMESIRDMVAGAVGGRAPNLAAAIHGLSGGNPMLVGALIEDLGRDGAGGGEDLARPVIGAAYAQAVLACLYRWEPSLLDVARALAVLGDDTTTTLIARLAGAKPDHAEQVLNVLTTAGLLANGRFRHPVAAAAVLDDLSAEEYARLHLRAAELHYQAGSAPLEIAGHLLAAGRADLPWAGRVLEDAAEHAVAENRHGSAVECLELALRYCGQEEADRVSRALARTVWQINPSAAVPYLAPLRAGLAAGTLDSRDAVTLARHALWQGDEALLAEVLDEIDRPDRPSGWHAAAELRLAQRWFYGVAPAGNVCGDEARPLSGCGADPQQHRDPSAESVWARAIDVLGNRLDRSRHDGAVAQCAERILASSRFGDTILEVVAGAVLVLVYCGEVDKADMWCSNLLDGAIQQGFVAWQAMLGSIRAAIALRRGSLAAAHSGASSALRLLSAHGWGILIGYPLSILVAAATALGRHDEAADAVRQLVPAAMYRTVWGLRYLSARGHHHLATGRVLAAVDDFQTCGRLARERGLDLPSPVAWRNDLAEANLRLGDLASARKLAAEQLALIPDGDGRTRGVALRLLAACEVPDQRVDLLEQSVAALELAGDRFELARSRSDLSQAYFNVGQIDHARGLARRATQERRACQAESPPPQPGANGARQLTKCETGPDAEDASVLSQAERKVAVLAALGHTNRDISRRLFVTISTVEQHLTRVYRKLGVNSRTDLLSNLSMRGFLLMSACADAANGYRHAKRHEPSHGSTPQQPLSPPGGGLNRAGESA